MTFPITPATPVRHAAALPRETDVVVIGGGVMGVMTALFLAKAGTRVVLCEKGRIAGEQSSRNWGWIRQQGRDPAELPIVTESLQLWRGFADQIGDRLGFRQSGVMYLANSDSDLAEYEAWMPHAAAHGVDTRMMARCEIEAAIGTSAAWKGAMFTPSDGRAEPWVAVPLLAEIAAGCGVLIAENCAVRALDLAAGRIAGVVTEAGRIACDRVVLAGGAWSRLLLAAHGIAIPQLSVLASVAATQPMDAVFEGAGVDADFAFRRRADGGYTIAPGSAHDFLIGPDALRSFGAYLPVLKREFKHTRFRPAAPSGFPDGWGTPRNWGDGASPFEAMRILNPQPNMTTIARVQGSFAAAFPGLGRPKLRTVWAGMIDSMPDTVPVIDHTPLPGLTLATGLSGHGFGIGPGMGRVVADLVLGRPTGHDLTRFRFGRFSEGSSIAPGPAL